MYEQVPATIKGPLIGTEILEGSISLKLKRNKLDWKKLKNRKLGKKKKKKELKEIEF